MFKMLRTVAFTFIMPALGAAIAICGSIFAGLQCGSLDRYGLPFPRALAIAVVLLPAVELIFQTVCYRYIASNKPDMPDLLKMCVLEGILVVVHLVMITITAERINIHKGKFEEIWGRMFTDKSPKIKVIEESFECCGFTSVKDRVYPFPGKDVNATACVDFYGFSEPCFPHLHATTRRIAITLFCVLIVTLIVSLVSFWFLMKRGFREAGLGFIFQPYRDDPNLGRWESEVDETAPLLGNRFQEQLETGTTLDEGGSIAQASAD